MNVGIVGGGQLARMLALAGYRWVCGSRCSIRPPMPVPDRSRR